MWNGTLVQNLNPDNAAPISDGSCYNNGALWILQQGYWFAVRRLTVLTDNVTRACSVGPCATLGQMLVKSELPLDSALVNDSDIKTLGWICFLTPKVGKFIKSKMAATEFMKCTLCHIFATR